MYVTMLEVFQMILPSSLTIQRIQERDSDYQIDLEMNNYSTRVYLKKCVVPGGATRHARSVLATAMSSLYLNMEKIESAKYWLDTLQDEHRCSEFSVAKRDTITGRETPLYEYLDSLEDAYLLCQLAMTRKQQHELVFIYPGSNKGLDEKEDLYKKALDLEHQVLKYMSED